MTYFRRSGLSSDVLADVWDIVTSKSMSNCLLPYDFSVALHLIAQAQQGISLRQGDNNLSTSRSGHANHLGKELAAPYVGFHVNDMDMLHAMSMRTGIPLSLKAKNAFNKTKTYVTPSTTPRWARDNASSSSLSSSQYGSQIPCLELRPSPTNKKSRGHLRFLTASNGCLLSYPTKGGGLRLWVDVEGNLNPSSKSKLQSCVGDKAYDIFPRIPINCGEEDSSPSIEIPESLCECRGGTQDLPMNWKEVTCISSPEGDLFCTGHKDGRVRLWKLNKVEQQQDMMVQNDEYCHNKSFLCCCTWIAHRSTIRALVITAFGEVWTGSELGTVKAWNIADDIGWKPSNSFEDTTKTFQELRRKSEDDKGKGISAHAVTVRNIKGKERVIFACMKSLKISSKKQK